MMYADKRHDDLILSIDAGTQSIRAALIGLNGAVRSIVKRPIEPYVAKNPGWAEQEPDYYWDMLCATCRELLSAAEYPRECIQGVTITTQRATMINVDKDGKPLRPAIVWLDQRRADGDRIVSPWVRPFLKAARLSDTLYRAVENCDANWLRQNQPEVWRNTHKYLFLSGWFTYKLTGRFVDSSGNAVGYVPFNFKTQTWAGSYDIKWKLFPIEQDKLPDLVRPAEPLGTVTQRASEETGIPRGLPLIAASNDKACEILGAGCLSPDTACISLGTIGTVNTPNAKYVELRPFWPPFPSAIPGHYYTEVPVQRGFWMVTWFKQEFGLQERTAAMKEKVSPEELLDRLAMSVPAGSKGLVLQPYWSPGPNIAHSAKGSIIGFGDVHTRAHVYRAILEGIVFALKEGAQLTERKNGVPITNLRVSGGGSQSDAVMQITADIFGMPAVRPRTHETSALGAAIDAAVGLKKYPDFPSAVQGMVSAGRAFEPIRENSELYRELHERVYKKIYKRLLPLFEEIREITGYPA